MIFRTGGKVKDWVKSVGELMIGGKNQLQETVHSTLLLWVFLPFVF